MGNFFIALNAIVPFLCYLSFGYFARARGVVDEDFLARLNKVTFRLFFPFVTFYSMYKASWEALPSLRLLVTVVASLLGLILLLLCVVPRFVRQRRRTGVVIQAIFRSNVLLYGLPLTVSLFGSEFSALAAMITTIFISVYNVMAVVVLELFNGEKRTSAGRLLLSVGKNPLLQGAVLGFLFFLFRLQLPASLVTAIAAFSNMTSPLALFVLGGTLRFSEIRKNRLCLSVTLVFRMLILPALMLLLGWAVGLRGIELFLLVQGYATPVATSSYPMAQNMGGDGELAGQFVVLSTVLSVFTLFGWIFFMKSAGLI